MTMRSWLDENPMLALALWFQVALAFFALIAMPFDKRQILGLNPWAKPLKFDISVAIFLVTMAGILSGLREFDRARSWIGGGIGIALTLENCIITLQSLRGVRSHMNFSTSMDAGLFASMGVLVVISTGLLIWTLGLVLIDQTRWPSALVLGVSLGLVTFMISVFWTEPLG